MTTRLRSAGVFLSWCLFGSPLAGQEVRAGVLGTVFDSVGRRPLAGALVQLVRADQPAVSRTARSGADGRFQLDSVAAGTYLLGFMHPSLDSLGLSPPIVHVTIRESSPVRAMLAVPSPATIVRSLCHTPVDSGGVWFGRIRSALDGDFLGGATITAQWSRIIVRDRAIVRELPTVTATSTDEGAFMLCYVPANDVMYAQVHRGADSSGVLSVAIPASGLLHRDVFIAPVTMATSRLRPDSAGTDSAVDVPVRAGAGQLRGRVQDGRGQPLAGARVRFTETGAEAIANTEGFFSLDSLPLGSFIVDARALGFMPESRQVDVLAGVVGAESFRLESRKTYLDTVKVISQRLIDTKEHQEFLRRKKIGFGYFVDEDDLERRNPLYVSDMLRLTPGVSVFPGAFGGTIRFRSLGGFAPYCAPAVFLDGMLMSSIDGMGGLDSFVNTSDVRAIEVYTRAAGMPAQFQTLNGCGSIVIWTGARIKRKPER